ncbi:MAG: hypothetical protein B7C24_16590 [Bacteroidetes bacterium 4572_77]|nr:MAG: hypothetical protein B7C24_16590 [Bacteroidetes bacterium 4572_77]
MSISSTWFGNNLGVITKSDTNQIQASGADDDTLGIASVSYTSEYNEHTLNPPSGMPTTYHIMIYIEATS